MNILRHIVIGPLRIHLLVIVSAWWIRGLSPANIEYRRRLKYETLPETVGWIRAVRDVSELGLKESKAWVDEHIDELNKVRLST